MWVRIRLFWLHVRLRDINHELRDMRYYEPLYRDQKQRTLDEIERLEIEFFRTMRR